MWAPEVLLVDLNPEKRIRRNWSESALSSEEEISSQDGEILRLENRRYIYLLFYVTFKSPGLKYTMPRIQTMYLLSYVTFKSGWGDITPENQKAYLLFYVTFKSPGLKNIMPRMHGIYLLFYVSCSV